MKKYLIIFAALLLGIAACDKKQKDNYPAVTNEGKNIWACKINGSPLIYKGKPTFGNENGVFATAFTSGSATDLTLYGSLTNGPTDKTAQSIEFSTSLIQIGEKVFFAVDSCSYYYIDDNDQLNTKAYISYYHSGWVRFERFDSQIISGEFELKVVRESNNTDTLNITQGRFDIAR